MRTPDDDRKRAGDLYALARSSLHADDGLVYVLRAMEVEADADLPEHGAIPEPKSDRPRLAESHAVRATRGRRA